MTGVLDVVVGWSRDRVAAAGNPRLLMDATTRRQAQCDRLEAAFRERYEGRAYGWVMRFSGWNAGFSGQAAGELTYRGIPFVFYLGTESRLVLHPGDWIEVSATNALSPCARGQLSLIGDDPTPPFTFSVGIRQADNADLRPLEPSNPRWNAEVRDQAYRDDVEARRRAAQRQAASRTATRTVAIHTLKVEDLGPGVLGLGKAIWPRTTEVQITDAGLKAHVTSYYPSGGLSRSETKEVGFWVLTGLKIEGDCLAVRYLQPAPWDPAILGLRHNAAPGNALALTQEALREALDAWRATYPELAPPLDGDFQLANCK